MYYSLILVSYMMLVIAVLISVAFIVLVERKVLGYIQIRKGPNKVGYLGILQSFGDAIKLFMKEQGVPSYSNMLPFYYSPVVSFVVVLLLWSLMLNGSELLNMKLGILFFFCCTSFGVYSLLGSGWSSNSNYAMLGCMRGVAQTISYEVSLALIILCSVFLVKSYSLVEFSLSQQNLMFVFMMMPLFFSWLASSLAETNRSPFDFAEGESELVSGFNIEYGSGGFALLFLAEYGSIIFMSYLVVVVYLGGLEIILFNIVALAFCYFFIWARGTLPRYRYDKLMYLAWKSYLPMALNFMGLYSGVIMFMFIMN